MKHYTLTIALVLDLQPDSAAEFASEVVQEVREHLSPDESALLVSCTEND